MFKLKDFEKLIYRKIFKTQGNSREDFASIGEEIIKSYG